MSRCLIDISQNSGSRKETRDSENAQCHCTGLGDTLCGVDTGVNMSCYTCPMRLEMKGRH